MVNRSQCRFPDNPPLILIDHHFLTIRILNLVFSVEGNEESYNNSHSTLSVLHEVFNNAFAFSIMKTFQFLMITLLTFLLLPWSCSREELVPLALAMHKNFTNRLTPY